MRKIERVSIDVADREGLKRLVRDRSTPWTMLPAGEGHLD